MAAVMAVATMVTNSKNDMLIMDKKQGWFLPELAFPWNSQDDKNMSLSFQVSPFPHKGMFASVSLNVSPASSPAANPQEHDMKAPLTDRCAKHAGQQVAEGEAERVEGKEDKVNGTAEKKAKKGGLKLRLKIKIQNPHLRRLVSGGLAGAVSRSCVAPLETIRTHLMVGSSGNSMGEVFQTIMMTEGWTGLFRGNFVNVVRVAPSKAIELFTYDTAKKFLTPKAEEPPKVPIPIPLVAGAIAGVSSTLCTYPLELIKTRLTIEKNVYDNFLHAFIKIVRDEGPSELYRGLSPSLIGVVPYAATNFYAYETLKKLYRRVFRQEEIGNVATLLIGSAAGAIASSATFPLEVGRKQVQVGAVGGRQIYKNVLHALYSILKKEGVEGLYRGLGPSCIKLMPAAGISFMCYEACKKILVDVDEEEEKDA